MTVYRSILIIAVACLFCACGEAPNTSTGTQTNSTPAAASPSPFASVDVMAEGRKLYLDNCAACHRETGKGGKITIEGKSINPDDLTADKIKKLTDDRLYGYIFNGIEDEGMPAFKDDLSEAQIREVVRYLRAEIQKMPLPEPTKRVGGVD